MRRTILLALTGAFSLFVISCSKKTLQNDTVPVNLTVTGRTAMMALAKPEGQLPGSLPDSIIIDTAVIVLMGLKFEDASTDATPCESLFTDADRVNLRLDLAVKYPGPYIVDIASGKSVGLGTAALDPGTYNKIRLAFHKLIPGQEVSAASPMAGKSIRIVGRYLKTGTVNPFVFTADIDENSVVKGDFSVSQQSSVQHYVLELNLGQWFKSKTNFLDPRDPANYRLIVQNIKHTITGGRDADGDKVVDL